MDAHTHCGVELRVDRDDEYRAPASTLRCGAMRDDVVAGSAGLCREPTPCNR
jgi:hypothetical protein